ncbi:MAG: CHAD domain-containing protein [Candidatus Binataceae bacterium]
MTATRAAVSPARLALSPRDGVREAARAALAFHLQGLLRERPSAEKGDAEAIHRLRVATRRLRTAIRLFRRALYASQADKLRRELATAAHAAGRVREADVTGELLRKRGRKLDPAMAKALGPISSENSRRRSEAMKELARVLDSTSHQAAVERLGTPAYRRGRDVALGSIASELLRPLLRAMMRAGRSLSDDAPPEALHRLRVRAKRVRYAIEMLGGLGRKKLHKTLVRLERLQDVLGGHNDVTSAIRWLRECTERSAMPADTLLAAGALLQILRARERKLARRGIKAWRRLARSGLLSDSLAEVRRTAAHWQAENSSNTETTP